MGLAADAVHKIYASPKKTAVELHDLWMQPLLDDGWTYGEYSRENKTHPCLVSFDELPQSEIFKDLVWYHLIEAFRDYYSQDV